MKREEMNILAVVKAHLSVSACMDFFEITVMNFEQSKRSATLASCFRCDLIKYINGNM